MGEEALPLERKLALPTVERLVVDALDDIFGNLDLVLRDATLIGGCAVAANFGSFPRTTHDIDLNVSSSGLKNLMGVLEDAGFVQGDGSDEAYLSFTKGTRREPLDLHLVVDDFAVVDFESSPHEVVARLPMQEARSGSREMVLRHLSPEESKTARVRAISPSEVIVTKSLPPLDVRNIVDLTITLASGAVDSGYVISRLDSSDPIRIVSILRLRELLATFDRRGGILAFLPVEQAKAVAETIASGLESRKRP